MPQKEQKKGKKARKPQSQVNLHFKILTIKSMIMRHGTSYPAVRLPTGEQWSQKVRQKGYGKSLF